MEGLRPKSLFFFRFWKDFGGLEAEICDFVLALEGFGGLEAEIFVSRFRNNFGSLGAEVFDSL